MIPERNPPSADQADKPEAAAAAAAEAEAEEAEAASPRLLLVQSARDLAFACPNGSEEELDPVMLAWGLPGLRAGVRSSGTALLQKQCSYRMH